MLARVAKNRHNTDMEIPNAKVAVRTLAALARAPRAGIEAGIRIMSPREVTDETRPV
jgi:hypothetical protein